MSGRATALRRCATLLARGCQAQLEREPGLLCVCAKLHRIPERGEAGN